MDFIKNLPSESRQKEFENNPLKILETIRNDKENEAFNDDQNQQSEKDESEFVNSIIMEKNIISSNKDIGKLEELKKNDISASFDLIKNKNQNLKDVIRNKIINNINNINPTNSFNCNNNLIKFIFPL